MRRGRGAVELRGDLLVRVRDDVAGAAARARAAPSDEVRTRVRLRGEREVRRNVHGGRTGRAAIDLSSARAHATASVSGQAHRHVPLRRNDVAGGLIDGTASSEQRDRDTRQSKTRHRRGCPPARTAVRRHSHVARGAARMRSLASETWARMSQSAWRPRDVRAPASPRAPSPSRPYPLEQAPAAHRLRRAMRAFISSRNG